MSKIDSVEEFEDPNEVKVVVDKNLNAIYFSREAIPSRKKRGRRCANVETSLHHSIQKRLSFKI